MQTRSGGGRCDCRGLEFRSITAKEEPINTSSSSQLESIMSDQDDGNDNDGSGVKMKNDDIHKHSHSSSSTPSLPLYHVSAIPAYLVCPYIFTHYRYRYTFTQCIKSLFAFHTETINIHSHLLATLIHIILFIYTLFIYLPSLPVTQATLMDYLLFFIFSFTAILTFFNSTIYHCFNCTSLTNFNCLYIADVSAIGLLIGGSYIPALYYAFICRPTTMIIYQLFIIIVLSAFTLLYQCGHCLTGRLTAHHVRVVILAAIVTFAPIPAVHFALIATTDFPHISLQHVMTPLITMLILYAIGFAFYLSRFPERRWPGRFDVVGHSHQYWHVAVAAAATVWHYGLRTAHEVQHYAICKPIVY